MPSLRSVLPRCNGAVHGLLAASLFLSACDGPSGPEGDDSDVRPIVSLDYERPTDQATGPRGQGRRLPRSAPEVLRAAQQHRDQMPAASIGEPSLEDASEDGLIALAPSPTARWKFIGPQGFRVNGRVNGAAHAPSNPAIRYLATMGGVWKSTNNGTNWTPMGDSLETLETTAIAVHPTNPNIVYVGTGDFDLRTPRYGLGILKSIDGGKTWQQVHSDTTETAVSTIVIDPDDPNIVMAASGRGVTHLNYVYRSTNAGNSWNLLGAPLGPDLGIWGDLEIGPRDSNGIRSYYVVGEHEGGSLWRSRDRGATWTQIHGAWKSAPWATNGCGPVALEVAASRAFPQTVYVAVAPPALDCRPWGLQQFVEIYVSRDGGDTFQQMQDVPRIRTQNGYDLVLDCGGNSEDFLYFGGQPGDLSEGLHAYRSATGLWSQVPCGHADQHDISINPANATGVMIANDGGVYSQTFSAGSGTWLATPINLNNTMGITQFYNIAVHPGDLTWVAGGTQDNGVVASYGVLSTWRARLSGDGWFTAFDPKATATILYAQVFGSLLRLVQPGDVNDNLFPPISNIPMPDGSFETDPTHPLGPAIAIDPNVQGVLYAATNYLYRFSGERTWKSRLGNKKIVATDGYATQAIEVTKGDSNLIYTGGGDGTVWMIQNPNATTPTIRNISGNLPDRLNRPIKAVSINPKSKFDILIGGDKVGPDQGAGGLWRCRNTQASTPVWESANGTGSSSLPVIGTHGITRDPDDPTNTWYVATEVGVFQTTNGGQAWSNATAPLGLPNVMATSIAVNPVTRYMTVGTHGRGAWRIKLNGGTLPDLAVTAATFSPSPARNGNLVTFTATIKNQGATATPANVVHSVEFLVDGSLVASSVETSTTSLAVGSTRQISAATKWAAVTGSHSLQVRVDQRDRISESNETNNTRTSTFTVNP